MAAAEDDSIMVDGVTSAPVREGAAGILPPIGEGDDGDGDGSDEGGLEAGDGSTMGRGFLLGDRPVMQRMARGMLSMITMDDGNADMALEVPAGADVASARTSSVRFRGGRAGSSSASAPLLPVGIGSSGALSVASPGSDGSPAKRGRLDSACGGDGGGSGSELLRGPRAGFGVLRDFVALDRDKRNASVGLVEALRRGGRSASVIEAAKLRDQWDDTSLDWGVFIKETLYRVFAPLSLPIVTMIEGRVGLRNREMACQDAMHAFGHHLPSVCVWVLVAITVVHQVVHQPRASVAASIQAGIMNTIMLYGLYCVSIGQRFGYMPRRTYDCYSTVRLDGRRRRRWYLSSWVNPDLAMLTSQLMSASLRAQINTDPADFYFVYNRGHNERALRNTLYPHRRVLDVLSSAHGGLTMKEGRCPGLLLACSIGLQSYVCLTPQRNVTVALVYSLAKFAATMVTYTFVDKNLEGAEPATWVLVYALFATVAAFDAYMYYLLVTAEEAMKQRREAVRFCDDVIKPSQIITIDRGAPLLVTSPPVIGVEVAENVRAWQRMRELLTENGRHFTVRHEGIIKYVFVVVAVNIVILFNGIFNGGGTANAPRLYGVVATSTALTFEAVILLGIIFSIVNEAIKANAYGDKAINTLRCQMQAINEDIVATERELYRRSQLQPAVEARRDADAGAMSDRMLQCLKDWNRGWKHGQRLEECDAACLTGRVVELTGARELIRATIDELADPENRYPIKVFGIAASPALLRVVGTVIASVVTAGLKPLAQKLVGQLL
mmetsp:Transcript_3528/g.12830  ORF Transcript_3528/g.12830 Transcript_3528/m.12830 type:complete len:780 (-) Transcript_3528:2315-4654(-)